MTDFELMQNLEAAPTKVAALEVLSDWLMREADTLNALSEKARWGATHRRVEDVAQFSRTSYCSHRFNDLRQRIERVLADRI